MQMRIYHLRARSPFHLGERGIGLEASAVIAHADTVFSALCTVWRQWYGQQALEALLRSFLTAPPFLVSSAFPYAAGRERLVRFYPRPQGSVPGMDRDDYDAFKRLKSVEFISEALFRQWVNGDLGLLDELPDKNKTNLLQDGHAWVTYAEADELRAKGPLDLKGQPVLWQKNEVTRVTVDRMSNSSAVYQAGRVTYAPEGGLWVGFQWRADSPSAQQVEEVLYALGDAGLGGERSAGHGQFEVVGHEDVEWPPPTGYAVTLAPFWPSSQEQASVLSGNTAYSLLIRRGWIGSPEGGGLRRKAVRMIGEGSVLAAPEGVLGGLADVTPQIFNTRPASHPVYRYGYALPVGMKRGDS